MAQVTERVTASILQDQSIQLTVQPDTGVPIIVTVPIFPSESEEEFLGRARQRIREAIVQKDHAGRQGSRFSRAVSQLTVSLDRPGPAIFVRTGSLLSGTVASGTAALLLILQEVGGGTRQARVTPTRPNDLTLPLEFSVHLGNAIALTLIPVGPEGLLGADQAVL